MAGNNRGMQGESVVHGHASEAHAVVPFPVHSQRILPVRKSRAKRTRNVCCKPADHFLRLQASKRSAQVHRFPFLAKADEKRFPVIEMHA